MREASHTPPLLLMQTVCRTLCCPLFLPLCTLDSPGKNTGVGCHFLLQGIFLTKESNLHLLHHSQILYHLSHQGNPLVLVKYLSLWCQLNKTSNVFSGRRMPSSEESNVG